MTMLINVHEFTFLGTLRKSWTTKCTMS